MWYFLLAVRQVLLNHGLLASSCLFFGGVLFFNVFPAEAIKILQTSLVILSISYCSTMGLPCKYSIFLTVSFNLSLLILCANSVAFPDSQMNKFESTFSADWLLDCLIN